MAEVVIVLKQTGVRCCSQCDEPMHGNRLQVRASTVHAHHRPLSFHVGVFCSVRCLQGFARRKKERRRDSIRGWVFDEERGKKS